MNRRTTLLALAGAVPAALAARVASATVPQVPPGQWRSQTLQYGTLAKLTSLIALKRSANPFVQAFANGEILEQTAFAQALTGQQNPPPATLTPAQQAALASVRGATDAEFDQIYLVVQRNGHQSLLLLQEGLLADGYPFTTRGVQQAVVAKAFIQNHLIALNLLLTNKQ